MGLGWYSHVAAGRGHPAPTKAPAVNIRRAACPQAAVRYTHQIQCSLRRGRGVKKTCRWHVFSLRSRRLCRRSIHLSLHRTIFSFVGADRVIRPYSVLLGLICSPACGVEPRPYAHSTAGSFTTFQSPPSGRPPACPGAPCTKSRPCGTAGPRRRHRQCPHRRFAPRQGR